MVKYKILHDDRSIVTRRADDIFANGVNLLKLVIILVSQLTGVTAYKVHVSNQYVIWRVN